MKIQKESSLGIDDDDKVNDEEMITVWNYFTKIKNIFLVLVSNEKVNSLF